MKAVPWVCLLALTTQLSRGATEWKETKSVVDTVVADSTDLPPPSVLVPIAARIPFKNFRYPHVDAQENVTFIADDPVYGGNQVNHGIYRSYAANGKLEALVHAGETAVPGSSAVINLVRGLQMDDDASNFVFWAYDNKGGTGLYYWKDSSLRMIARTGQTVLPGAVTAISDVEYGAVSNGKILYIAADSSGRKLVLFDLKTEKQRVLVSIGDPIPGQAKEKFRYLSPQNWIDGETVVFRGARTDKPRELSPSGEGHRGIYTLSGAQCEGALPELKRLVDWGTKAPGFEDRVFTDLRSAPVRDGVVAFTGSGAGFEGIYWADVAKGALHGVVDTNTSFESLFTGPFTGFSIFPSLLDHSIAFVGHAAGNYEGIFLYRIDRDELFLLTDNRTPLDGKKINGYEIAGHCLIRNRLAVEVDFSDGSTGVYLATIPPSGFLRATNASTK